MSKEVGIIEPVFGSRQTILIVDDSALNRALLADMVGEEFEIVEAENGSQAIAELRKLGSGISLVLLDYIMPEMDGFDVLRAMNSGGYGDIPTIMISSENDSKYIEQAYELGVTDFITRPFNASIVRHRVLNTLLLYGKQKVLLGMVADQVYEREKASNLMVGILSHIVEFRNGESGLHVMHVRTITELLLSELMKKTDVYDIDESEIPLIGLASSLHDIGKISIAENILNKPGRLTDEEFELMKAHTTVGSSMLDNLPVDKDEPMVKYAYEICRWHHERYDGRGYPDGLCGDEIPISAQVVALADVYDALTSKRVYKDAYSHETSINMILNGECGIFNPLLMEILEECSAVLAEKLENDSFSQRNYNDIDHIVDESLFAGQNTITSRTLSLLDYERMKYRFFATMSNEIQYEYTDKTDMIVFSDWGIHKLDLPETVIDPNNDERVVDVFGKENIERLGAELRNTTPDQAVVEFDFEAMIHGEPRWFHTVAQAIWSKDEPVVYQGSIGKFVDINEQKEHMIELQYRASHDRLTGLENRVSVRNTVNEKLAKNSNDQFVMMVVDLDNFKEANNAKGHLFGDKVLQVFSDKLANSVRHNDVVARVGGDEFVMVLMYNGEVESLVQRLYRTIQCEYRGYPIASSMGVSSTEWTSRNYDALFAQADKALYAIKRSGCGGYEISGGLRGGHYEMYEDATSVLSDIDAPLPLTSEWSRPSNDGMIRARILINDQQIEG